MPRGDARAAREALFRRDFGFASHAYVIGVARELNFTAIHIDREREVMFSRSDDDVESKRERERDYK